MSNKTLAWIIGIILVIGVGYLVLGGKPADQIAPAPGPGMEEKAMEKKELTGEVKIGAILPLTGDAASYGTPLQKAIQLAVEEINAKNGVGGKRLVVAFEDGKCDGKEGATAAQKLMNVEGVQAIIGGACSGETLGFAPIANEKKVVVISPSATSPDITTKGGAYVFRFAPSDALASVVAARYAAGVDVKAKKAAVLAENTDYAQGLRNGFVNEFKAQGGTVAVNEAWNTGTTDFRTQALKVKNAGVDVVYVVPQTPAPGIALVKALRDQEVAAKILTAEVLIGRDVAKDNKEVMEGVMGFEAAYNEEGPRAAAFIAAYKKRFNEELAFPFFMANAYSQAYLLKELIEKDGNEGAKLQASLAKLKDWDGGALEDVTLDEYGDIQWKSYAVKRIENGEVKGVSIFTL